MYSVLYYTINLMFSVIVYFLSFFFFQAEDGIRDRNVTGVQTCALPISAAIDPRLGDRPVEEATRRTDEGQALEVLAIAQIGRASCRERLSNSVGAESLKKKTKTLIEVARRQQKRVVTTRYKEV